MLDIGCGHGFLLQQAIARGYKAAGVEASQKEARSLQAKGYDVFAGVFHDYEIETELNYDIITLSHVLEQVSSPHDYLLKIKRSLHENGILSVAVPNTPWHTFLGTHPVSAHTAHIYYFSPRTLKAMLRACGYEIRSVSYGKGGAHLRILASPRNQSHGISKNYRLSLPIEDPEKTVKNIRRILASGKESIFRKILKKSIRKILLAAIP